MVTSLLESIATHLLLLVFATREDDERMFAPDFQLHEANSAASANGAVKGMAATSHRQ
jgi:hypothetical protein